MSENVPSDMCAQQRFSSACVFADWSEFSMGTFSKAKNAKFLHADNVDFDQTSRKICSDGTFCNTVAQFMWF